MGLFLFSQMRTTTGSPSRVITLRRPWLLWGLLLKGIWMTTKVPFEFSSSWFRHQHPLILRQAIVWAMSIAICIARFARRSSAGSCTNVFNAKAISLCAGIARRPANIPNTSSYVSSETRYYNAFHSFYFLNNWMTNHWQFVYIYQLNCLPEMKQLLCGQQQDHSAVETTKIKLKTCTLRVL